MTATDAARGTIALSARRRWAILAVCASALFLVGLDTTIVSIGLPQIGLGLGLDVDRLAWVIDAYTVPFASLLITAGALADRFGRRRVFQIGLVVFAVASLAGAAAPSLGWLIAARALQGVGASMLTPVALAIVVGVMTDPRERAQAIGIWASVFGVSLAAGPLTGGALIAAFDWRAVFWINVPVVLVALILVAVLVPESRAAHARRLDIRGQVLLVLLIGGMVAVLIEAPHVGWTSPVVILGIGAVLLTALGFFWAESRSRQPLIDPHLFQHPGFAGAVAGAVALFVGFSVTLLLTTVLLQGGEGWTPLAAGAATLPMAIGAIVGAPLSGYLVGRAGPRIPLLVAGALLTLGGALLTTLAAGMNLTALLVAFLLIGLGVGLGNPPITNTAVNSLPLDRAGVAGGVTSTARQVGTALGIALAGTIAASESFVSGWIIITACGAVLLGVAALAPARPEHR